jgi:hypothetical protein
MLGSFAGSRNETWMGWWREDRPFCVLAGGCVSVAAQAATIARMLGAPSAFATETR